MMVVEGRKHALADMGDVLVLGLGVSGRAAVRYLAPLVGTRVRSLTVLAGKQTEDALRWSEELDKEFPGAAVVRFGVEDAASVLPEGAGSFDLCIASPGISMFSDFYQSAAKASDAVISEVELAWRESAADSIWVAITGTNGKTTTTALCEHLLKSAGLPAKAVGNIGDACIEQVASDVASGESRVYVVEASSYQLASVDKFAPNVAVVLGITPDHIKWHRTHEHYASSKFKALENLAEIPGAVAVLDATNDEVRAKVKELKAEGETRGFDYVPIGTKAGAGGDMRKACGSENAAFVTDGGMLDVALRGTDNMLAAASDLQILGTHNQLNALAASAAAIAAGADAQAVAEALPAFRPLEHRIEPSGEVAGVLYYNDSKATNVDATLQALKAFAPRRPIVMLGGDDKGTDLSELVDACAENVKAAVCYGEGGPRFHEALLPLSGKGIDVTLVGTFDEAFAAASGQAQAGDIVLLSPACASFDEFTCFEERGERFKELVGELGK